jgi:hypothetical protein
MLETDVGLYAIDVRITKPGPTVLPNDFEKQAYMFDPLDEKTERVTADTGRRPELGKKYLDKYRRLVARVRFARAERVRRRSQAKVRPWKRALHRVWSSLIMPLMTAASWLGATARKASEKNSRRMEKLSVWVLNTKVQQEGNDDCLDNMHVLVGSTDNEVKGGKRPVVPVAACPDTGAGRSVCGPDLLKALRVQETQKENVTLTAANGEKMPYEGTVRLRLKFEDHLTDIQALVTSSVKGRLIVGKPDLIRMRVIPPNFPSVIPQEAYQLLD